MGKINVTLIGDPKNGHQIRNSKEFVRVGDVVCLMKAPGNPYDDEAIAVYFKYDCNVGGAERKLGYVANSVDTVSSGTYSSGRLYDKIGDCCKARITTINRLNGKFVTIAEVL